MKTKKITTSKATILAVDLPFSLKNIYDQIFSGLEISIYSSETKAYGHYANKDKELPYEDVKSMIDAKLLECTGGNLDTRCRVFEFDNGNWQHLGQLSDITEDQWKGIVYKSESFGLYENYCETVEFGVAIRFNTATESGLSLLKANGVLLDNPYGEKEPNFIDVEIATAGSAVSNDFDSKVKSLIAVREKWQQAQQQVWKNVHIFIKR